MARSIVIFIICFLMAVVFPPFAAAEKEEGTDETLKASKPAEVVPSSFDISAEDILLYRVFFAEQRAIQCESTAAIEKRREGIQILYDKWKADHGIEDLAAWQVDTKNKRLIKNRN